MKGNNELVLNQATMIEAVQYWLDSRMVQPVPKVTGVVRDATKERARCANVLRSNCDTWKNVLKKELKCVLRLMEDGRVLDSE